LNEKPQTVSLRYYGISPWEIEVIYNIFNEKFEVIQEATDRDEYFKGWNAGSREEFVSALTITIPLQFSEEFFKWFGFKAWEKVKSIIKEMKRRRGNGKAIRVEILFQTEEWNKIHYGDVPDGKSPILSDNDERLPDYPDVLFVTESSENHNFNSAIEKIDFMVELLPYHLNHSEMKKFCKKPMVVRYYYDIQSGKWYVEHVLSYDGGRGFTIDSLRD
jgi:hypothetical protein